MSVNNNASVSADNPFADLGSLKDANLDERERAILSDCNYKDLKIKWTEGLHNISNNARTHIRNVKEVKESFFCHIGNVLGFVNSEPLKEVHEVFSNFDLFDRYVRNNISPETYKKIAKANPAYFDKVIKHLEDSAKELDIKADARIDTFCSSSTGQALARAATRFRDTADYLKRMMHGDDAAKPGNNNANPGSNQGQPTVINHYHNNIHIGDINIGHLGDNNFHNKGGNMGVMFKESSNGVPHTGFKSEYSVSKTENLFYSPTINGMKLLDVTAENALKLLGPGEKDENKENNGNPEFEAKKKLHKEKSKNIEQAVDPINLKPEDLKLYETKKDSKSYKREEAENTNPVQPQQTAIENLNSRLRDLHAMFFANWDTIRKEIKEQNNKALQDKQKQDKKMSIQNAEIFEQHPIAKGGKITPENILKEIEDLSNTLHNLAKNDINIQNEFRFNAETMLRDIAMMMSSDKQTAKQDIENKREKSGNTILGDNPKDHGIQFPHIGDEDIKNAKAQYKEDISLKKLLEDTWQIIQEIRTQAELKKK